jgi:formate hydrogenlyase subunit 3/multisubunit Na+/H+ antiporter MnhD subunit
MGGLSLAGLPGTVGFVSRWTAARAIGLHDLEALVLVLLAGASVGVGVVRGMIALYASATVSTEDDDSVELKPTRPPLRGTVLVVVLAVILVITLGIAPGITEPLTRPIAQNYTFYK